MTGSGQQSEPEEDIAGLVKAFGDFIIKAKFDQDANGLETCTDPQLKKNAQHLFRALGYEKEVSLLL
jgi:hypothetical protein